MVLRAGLEPARPKGTAPSRQRVYQFHHLSVSGWTNRPRAASIEGKTPTLDAPSAVVNHRPNLAGMERRPNFQKF